MFERFRQLIGAQERGARGEDLAAGWLARERGCKILARNWRSPRDRRCEIDVVALDRGVLVFVEVKTRARHAMVSGYTAVNARKRDAVRRAILTYLACLQEKPAGVRFDVIDIGLSGDGRQSEIRHFENVRIFGRYWQP